MLLDVALQGIALVSIGHVVLRILVDDVVELIELGLENLLLLLLRPVQLLVVLQSLLSSLSEVLQVLLFLVLLLLARQRKHGCLVLLRGAFRQLFLCEGHRLKFLDDVGRFALFEGDFSHAGCGGSGRCPSRGLHSDPLLAEIFGHERVLVDPGYFHHDILPDHALHGRRQHRKMRDFQSQREGLQGGKGRDVGEQPIEVDLPVDLSAEVSDDGRDEIARRIILHYNRCV